ncbi:uncharacterized protein LOC127797999 [Diospyros lotus]|uniref:uncharacterized protein LOC127797999 n=1 Tax=Diospyros lotus TaxID=55363 RepID=UPI00225A4974|nr:uncharacterized protein LOC127797999 [Diospyros lotus]
MASESKSTTAGTNGKKRKQRYISHNKAPKKKGLYPIHPGLEGFFITCDGGRERQAANESLNLIDSFYEELVHRGDSGAKLGQTPKIPLNKKTKFTYSDSSDEDDKDDDPKDGEDDKDKQGIHADGDANDVSSANTTVDPCEQEGNVDDKEKNSACQKSQAVEGDQLPLKKQCLGTDTLKCEHAIHDKVEKSVDKLIEEELEELGDKSKRRFLNLDSGCNGVVFVQMRKRDGDPSPTEIVQHMMTSVASTRKHMSRFMLRVLPIEVTCYASEDEITRAIKPLIAQHFPVETQTAHKFAVLYDARANTGIDRMKIVNAVAKSVPAPHKVDLNSPDKNIVVQIVKTMCLIGVVEKYKELAKYNLRQLTLAKA